MYPARLLLLNICCTVYPDTKLVEVEGHSCTFCSLFGNPIVKTKLMLNRKLILDVVEQKID